MLYFAYGSNLHHFQMKRRCKDSIFLKKINLKGFRLTLDVYEDFPILYKKYYFYYYGKKVMTYTMVKKSQFKFPTERYLNIVKRGYSDCKLDNKFLTKALKT
jgi:hypothetical protein